MSLAIDRVVKESEAERAAYTTRREERVLLDIGFSVKDLGGNSGSFVRRLIGRSFPFPSAFDQTLQNEIDSRRSRLLSKTKPSRWGGRLGGLTCPGGRE